MIDLHLVFKSGVVLTLKGMDMHAPVSLRIGILFKWQHGYSPFNNTFMVCPHLHYVTWLHRLHKPLVNHLYLMFWVLSSMAVIVPRMVNGQVIAAR